METESDGLVTIYRCGNCDQQGVRISFLDAEDLLQRLEPGDIFTDVECPKCHALAYPVEVEISDHKHMWSSDTPCCCLKCGSAKLEDHAASAGMYDKLTGEWKDEEYKDVVEDFDSICPVSTNTFLVESSSLQIKHALKGHIGKEITPTLQEELVEMIMNSMGYPEEFSVIVTPDEEHKDKINIEIKENE